MRISSQKRHGVAIVESMFVLPVAIVLIIAIVAGALGVATYQQVAAMAREGSRWASVKGTGYTQDTGNPTPTATDLYNNVLTPRFVNMDPGFLTYSLAWSPDNRVGSSVTVTVGYQMSLPIYGTMTFFSTATSPVTW